MTHELALSRIEAAGVDIAALSAASVTVKIGETNPGALSRHPVLPFLDALGAMGSLSAVQLCGSPDYLRSLPPLAEACRLRQCPGLWVSQRAAECLVRPTDFVLDLSNDGHSARLSCELSRSWGAQYFALTWGPAFARISPSARGLGGPSPASRSGSLAPIERIVAGLALQELVMAAGGLRHAAPLEGPASYSPGAEDRTSVATTAPRQPRALENVTIDVVGAGATGVHLLLSLVPLVRSGQVRIFDPDFVGIENLSLQCAFQVQDLGQSKAVVMARKLDTMRHPDLRISPFPTAYEDQPPGLPPPDLRIVCADNWAVRAWSNTRSLSDGVPLAEAGSSPLAAQQRTYVPGLTACLEHRIPHLADMAARQTQGASCALNPTLPGTNMIIGGILALEALKAIRPRRFGAPSRGVVTYDARAARRFGVVHVRPPCVHRASARPRVRAGHRP